MSKQIKVIGLVAVLALVLAVIGIYTPVSKIAQKVAKDLGSTGFTNVIGIGGPPTRFSEIELADGETVFGSRELKMAAGTSTLIFTNRSGDDILISNPILAVPSGSTTVLSSYVWVLASTTIDNDLTDESATAIPLTDDNILMSWLTATGTGATSTSAAFLRNNHSPISAAVQTNGGGESRDFPIILQNNNALVLRLYALANVVNTGQGVGVEPATSTDRGFDPILKFDYETID